MAAGSTTLVHCVGDDPTESTNPEDGGGDSGSPDGVTPVGDGGVIVDSGDAGICAATGNPNVVCGAGVNPCIIQIAGGGQTFCARDNDCNVYCWGSNRDGQLATDPHVTPFSAKPLAIALGKLAIGVDVGGPRLVTELGFSVACARVTSVIGTPTSVACWGSDRFGQLGFQPAATAATDGGYTLSTTPTTIPSLNDSIAISTGAGHVCSIAGGSGQVFCWGNNGHGELARGTDAGIDPQPGAVLLSAGGTTVFDSVAVGFEHTCFTNHNLGDRTGCAGQNVVGQLGDGDGGEIDSTDASSITPVGAPTYVLASALDSAGNSTCAITGSKSLLCWGENGNSELGTGTATPGYIPEPVIPVGLDGTTPVSAHSSGFDHRCALLAVGTPADGGPRQNVYCWGINAVGQSGQPVDGGPVLVPTPVSGLPNSAVAVAAGSQATCALLPNGTVWCWGYNSSGQLGNRGAGGDDGTALPPGQVAF